MAQVPINPSVLAWAIAESGREPSDIASSIGISASSMDAWLAGRDQPSVTQLRKMATVLRRPTATFLLPAPPRSALPKVEFRHPPERENRQISFEERLRLREAGRLQKGLQWVSEELSERPVNVPQARVTEDPEKFAADFRATVGVPVESQTAWRNEYAAFREWRLAVERLGVVVLALPMGPESARGFSTWDDQVPLVAINTHWTASARIFSLFHEIGHLVTRTSSLCEESVGEQHKSRGDPTERWCESFAAAFLMPWPSVEVFLRSKGWNGRSAISDLSVVRSLARRYKVSLRAAALRLINKDKASWSLYRAIPEASEKKPIGGGGGGGRSRPEKRLDEYGHRTARLLAKGLEREVVGRDDVLSYLNIGDAELPAFVRTAEARLSRDD